MSGSNFDIIAREILKQKQLMDQMLNENRELRQQLAELRAGHGIFVEIQGKRFPLTSSFSPYTPSLSQENTASLTLSSSIPAIEPTSALSSSTSSIEEAQTQAIQKSAMEPAAAASIEDKEDIVEMIPPATPEIVTAHPTTTIKLVEEEATSNFLEEAMIDEFAHAATSPLAIWSGPPAPHNDQVHKVPTNIEEEEKASLRRQLMDSFMLG